MNHYSYMWNLVQQQTINTHMHHHRRHHRQYHHHHHYHHYHLWCYTSQSSVLHKQPTPFISIHCGWQPGSDSHNSGILIHLLQTFCSWSSRSYSAFYLGFIVLAIFILSVCWTLLAYSSCLFLLCTYIYIYNAYIKLFDVPTSLLAFVL